MKILIINGPNINLTGVRQPEIYGNTTFDEFFAYLKNKYTNHTLEQFQSNSEGKIIDKIHEARYAFQAIIINAGAYTHTSLAIADAVSSVDIPAVEVHISNTARREKFRQKSFLSSVCKGTITGFGLKSYELAVESLL